MIRHTQQTLKIIQIANVLLSIIAQSLDTLMTHIPSISSCAITTNLTKYALNY